MADIRNLNTFTLGAGFNVTSGESIDSRQHVTSIEQIYDPKNWEKVKPYNGLMVISADGEVRICIDADNYQLEASWRKIEGGGITGISGDEYIKVGGTSTSKSLTLEVTKVVTAVSNSLVAETSAIQKDENGQLQLVWSSI